MMGKADLGVIKFGSKCWYCASPHKSPVLMLSGRRGKWLLPVSLFSEGSVNASLGHAVGQANNLPTVCPRYSLDHGFHTVGLWTVLPSLQEQYTAL